MRLIHSRKYIFLAAFAALLMLSAGTAVAQDAQPATTPHMAKTSKEVCGKSTLTQEQFLDMIHAIAMHGDLTDISFIEKTLGVKFTSPHDYLGGTAYDVESYRGTQIKISLLSYDTPGKDWLSKPPQTVLAGISFYGLDKTPSSFHDCGDIEKDKLDQKFAPYAIQSFYGKGIRTMRGYSSDDITAVFAKGLLNDVVGKYGATTDIAYYFRKTSKVVTWLTIRQIVPNKLSNHQ